MTGPSLENADGLTLMAVHAHPDDEAIGTGGVLARYSAEGARTVLVTCTNGEQGDGARGAKPGDAAHDPAEVAATRLAELRSAVAHLQVGHLELLGYRDSGMAGWPANHDPEVFSNVPVAVASDRLADLMRRYRPQVVVTYDEKGAYGHPDHIQAHRITLAAAESTGIPAKLYYTAVPRSGFQQLRDRLQASGVDVGDFELPEDFGTPEELITTVVDVSSYIERKLAALNAHASQTENFFLARLPDDVVNIVLSTEYFSLRSAPPGTKGEADLFAGLH